MNYIHQLNAFKNRVIETDGMSAGIIAVYHALLHINNEQKWVTECEIDFGYVLVLSRVDKTTYYKALDFLLKNNFLESYKKGVNHYAKARVRLKVLYENSIGNKDLHSENSIGKAVGEEYSKIHLHTENSQGNSEQFINNKHIPKKKTENINNTTSNSIKCDDDKFIAHEPSLKKEKSSAKKENNSVQVFNNSIAHTKCVFSIEFQTVWLELIQSPKWSKKSQEAINKSLEKLMKYEESFAINQVECAIASDWQGVVFTNTDTEYAKYVNQKKSNGFTDTSRGVQAALKVAEVTMNED